MVHACNPSYPGGRDQEDSGLKPAQGNNSGDPISKKKKKKKKKERKKKKHHKRACLASVRP
jgi:hypothetical protein